jgi:beta-mannanase
MISWEPWSPGKNHRLLKRPADQPRFALSNIASGRFDPYIRRWARGVRSLGGPVMVRLMHEMNGTWYPWSGTVNGNSSALFRAAWRHIHDLFQQEGATNVTWVWSVNRESVPNTRANSFAAYYPGDAYVDWVAASGFNFGTSTPASRWRGFTYTYSACLPYLKSVGKPVMIAEMGSVPNGGDKAAWITDAYARIRSEHPEVKAVVYYDALDAGPSGVAAEDWRLGRTADVRVAYAAAVAGDYFLAGPSTTLGVWESRLTAPDWAHLRSLAPVY